MTRSVFKGDSVIATHNNSEGLTPGATYKVIEETSADSLVYVSHKGRKTLCSYSETGTCPELYDVKPVPKPIKAPWELLTPDALVKHQQDVVVAAMRKWIHSRMGSMKAKPTVVGGAARDWDYNIPAQDIDIWVKNSQFGEEDLNTLKELFEPLGATVGQVTNNTYARDGEYIHYIFNVMWQGVDLQFIFVEDSSVKAVTDHVCCNFSEISWDWETRMLHPTYVYKAGRKARTLVFRDDKGRSPRECYMDKMAKRYPDHAVIRPGETNPIPPERPSGFLEGEWKVEPFPAPKKLYVEALETSPANSITCGRQYEVLADDGKFWSITADNGQVYLVYKTRFKEVKHEITRKANQVAPEGYTKFLVRNAVGVNVGHYWLSRGNGSTALREEAHVYTLGEATASVNPKHDYIWIE